MDYPQILAPILGFLHCPTPQAWIDEARKPENLPLLLTDHMVCELKAAQNAMLLVRRYVADKEGADELLACLKPYEDFTYRWGPEPDFVALHKQINKSVMPQTDDPWGRQLLDSMILLSKRSCITSGRCAKSCFPAIFPTSKSPPAITPAGCVGKCVLTNR